MFQRLEFGADAKAYIRFQLSTRSSFWRYLCELPLEMGRVFAFLPLTPTIRDLLHFAWHINSREDLESGTVDSEYREKEREFIASFLLGPSNRLAVFYGGTAPPLKRPVRLVGGVTTFFFTRSFPNNYSSEVPTITDMYYLVRAGVSGDTLDEGLSVAQRMPFFGALTSLPEGRPLPGSEELDDQMLRSLASRTESILVGAYGDDATLIWTRV